ncbi:JAB domain-containing protein [Xanthocytophaga agilis]|uniref:JAB domain-containing protein n=1 Tax=Xanthocytophaga agilis TaxID=3048010 RepID=A0AAE3RCB4_9BACT|nr:JAB domain-containing protein [Xanthocytophaga agilis]MDJ1505750.1 JAB domain-containing protein [Xanthocytophaga agilis]
MTHSEGTITDVKLIFQAALGCNASSIIVAHNHPLGNLKPSQADKDLTDKLRKAGHVLELPLLDYLILSSEGYFSFADEGLL